VEKFGEVAAEFYPQVFADLHARLDPVMDQQPECTTGSIWLKVLLAQFDLSDGPERLRD
jgi:hypothetical protein